MLLSPLLLLLAPLALAAPGTSECIPSGNGIDIHNALALGGPGTTVTLCPGSTHRLKSPILFTSTRQTLTTEGNPLGRERALLIVEGEDQAVAIKADCRDCSHAMIRSLIVDGNRPLMLRVPKGGGLLELGNAEGQTVRDCRLFEPRGWTALHFREGDLKQCNKAYIAGNDIGPSGEEWDDDYDGVNEVEPINGNPRADGISLACKNSLVERNIVTDATDGGIVLFGASGSEVRDNHIYSRTRVLLGGINLVDYEPWKGDYYGTVVHHNTIHALAGFLRVGIVIGLSSWSDDTDAIVHSGTVTDNILEGTRFGYGLVVSSADQFTVLRNTVSPDAVFSGVPGARCPTAPANGPPTAFLINKGSATGTYQSEFINGEVQHIICINPPDEDGVPYKPWRLRDSPNAVGQANEVDPLSTVSFDSRLAEAVVSYQMRLLKAMSGIHDRIERQSRNPELDGEGQEVKGKGAQQAGQGQSSKGRTGVREVDGLWSTLDELDQGEKKLQREMEAVQRDMLELTKKIKRTSDDSKPILSDVFRNVAELKIPSANDAEIDRPASKPPLMQKHAVVMESMSGLGPTSIVLGSAAIIVLALAFVKKYRASARSTKKGKLF